MACTILIVAPPLVTLQDVTGPWEVFCRAELHAPGTYDVVMASTSSDLCVTTKFGLDITCQRSALEYDGPIDTVLVGGSELGVEGRIAPAFTAWLQGAAKRTRRMGSVCTGAFYLAHAGLLANRSATTHWRYTERLRTYFPDITVDPQPVFVRSEDIYTSAGITAGIDLALALVEEDCGHAVSQKVAQELVVFLQRQGDQPQLSSALALRMADRDPIRHFQQHAPDNLQNFATVDDMAAFANMSPRNFSRQFKAQTGITPGAYMRQLRVEAARRRLQECGNIDRVAAQLGFGSSRSLHRLLRAGAG